MKKVVAFGIALILCISSAVGLHLYSKKRIHSDSNAFASWTADSKFGSRDAILENINENTVLAFGSSEFQHGKNTPYHPRQVFQKTTFNMMLLGSAYYQSLSHAVALASLGNNVPTKQAVLFISPPWFDKKGVLPEAYSSRFSETHYIAMLKNPKISDKTKQYIINRTLKLLKADPSSKKRAELYERVLYTKDASLLDKVNYKLYTQFLAEKELQSVSVGLTKDRIKQFSKKIKELSPEPDFSSLIERAEKDGESHNSTNPFYMDDKIFLKKIHPLMKRKKNENIHGNYNTSPEYDDLKCFLEVCRELEIKPLLVSLPVNGYWYDHTGFPKKARQEYYSNIRKIASEYGASLADFSNQEYTKYFFEDGIHIGKKGWVMVNESIYNFYQENKTDKTL
nr:D-alanyl-lipoteichoic acid biosynthesis protein DltD [uncultured Sellimonas sp.]